MKISIQRKKNTRYDLDFGYHTECFQNMYWFTIVKVEFDNTGVVDYAKIVFELFKNKKHWNKRDFKNTLAVVLLSLFLGFCIGAFISAWFKLIF